MLREDTIRMLHMLDAAREAISFSRGRTRTDLDSDKMLTFALVRAIEIVGEAASKVTAQTRSEFPEMPWQDIVGMRNRIVHAYFDIDLDRVWGYRQDRLAGPGDSAGASAPQT